MAEANIVDASVDSIMQTMALNLGKEESRLRISQVVAAANKIEKMKSANALIRYASTLSVEDDDAKNHLLAASKLILDSVSRGENLEFAVQISEVLHKYSFAEDAKIEFSDLSDSRKAYYLVLAGSIIDSFNIYLDAIKTQWVARAWLQIKDALNLYDEGQFDSDAIDFYKANVLNVIREDFLNVDH